MQGLLIVKSVIDLQEPTHYLLISNITSETIQIIADEWLVRLEKIYEIKEENQIEEQELNTVDNQIKQNLHKKIPKDKNTRDSVINYFSPFSELEVRKIATLILKYDEIFNVKEKKLWLCLRSKAHY